MFYEFYEAVKPTAHNNNNNIQRIKDVINLETFLFLPSNHKLEKLQLIFITSKQLKNLNWIRLNLLK
jgi:hypothetical protein